MRRQVEIGHWEMFQPVYGYPHGECVRTSYACLLELPLEAVPKLDPYTIGNGPVAQREAERAWLRKLGYDLLVVPHVEGKEPPDIPPDLKHLMTVYSSYNGNTFKHRVVGQGGKVLWDPHPKDNKLVGVDAYCFLVPIL